jgi:hypothetical protein
MESEDPSPSSEKSEQVLMLIFSKHSSILDKINMQSIVEILHCIDIQTSLLTSQLLRL